MDHRPAGRDKLLPEIHVDICFMRSKTDVATKCIGQQQQKRHGQRGAGQGRVKPIPSERINAFTRVIGLEAQDLVLRSDQLCRSCWRKWVADAFQQRLFTRSHLWDRRLRMAWSKEECRLLKGSSGC